jgi:hypothetical protein
LAGPTAAGIRLRGSFVTHSRIRFGLGTLALLALAPSATLAGARPDTLGDGTWTDRWTLKNGLEVTVRHIPNATSAAVVTAYRVGRDQDPPGRDGMADLLAEVLLTAPAGDLPERRYETTDSKPQAWSLQVTARFSLDTELASSEQFPDLLRRTATRMRGVTVTDSLLGRSLKTATRDLSERYLGSPELTLMNQVRDLAAGVSDETLVRRAAGRAIRSVTAREVTERLGLLYVPANAVLALAGNFEGMDLRSLVAGLFEGIPGGTALREPPPPPLKAASRTITRSNLDEPLGVVAVLAPALDDPLHPSFYLSALVVGKICEVRWGAAPQPLPGRSRYPIFADPQFVQFFPPVQRQETEADQLGVTLQAAVQDLVDLDFDPEAIEDIRDKHVWILGGPMKPPFLEHVSTNAGTLRTLATTMAVRALWGSEDFWARYRARFMDPDALNAERWVTYFQPIGNRLVRLLLTPARR